MQNRITPRFPQLPFQLIIVYKIMIFLERELLSLQKPLGLLSQHSYILCDNYSYIKIWDELAKKKLELDGCNRSCYSDEHIYFIFIAFFLNKFSYFLQLYVSLQSLMHIIEIFFIINKRIQQMIHTFSPNWYKPQCLFFEANYLYYASNYVLYRYNLDERKVELDKCFRKIAMATGMNSKDIKIHTIAKISEEWLIIGTNQPHAVIISKNNFQVLGVVRNMGISSAYICHTGYNEADKCAYALFADESGLLCKAIIQNPSQYKLQPVTDKSLPIEKVKDIMAIGNLGMVVYTKGHMVLFNQCFDEVLQVITPAEIGLDQEYILSLDLWRDQQILWACMLTRTKNNSTFIHFWSMAIGEQMQESKKQVGFKSILKSQVKIIYPKAMNEKVKNAQKAAMSIKFINATHLLVSGKLGQLFILDLHKCPEQITIKPHAIDDIPPCLQISNDSKHYKEIYAIYSHQRPKAKNVELFTISTDQTMAVWNVVQDCTNFMYNIKFITAELTSIFYCQADPKIVFFLLKDSIIRSAVPLSTQNYYLNEYWKYTKKFKVVKAVAHLEEPGITAMVTQCGKVLIYDLFDDRLMKIINFQFKQSPQQIINISYEYSTIKEPVQQLINQFDPEGNHLWQDEVLKINRYHTKQIKNNDKLGILVQLKNKLVFITEAKEDQDQICSIPKICRIQRIHNTKLWDGYSLLFSQNKNNNLRAWLFYNNEVMKLNVTLKLGGRCIFKISEKTLRVIEYKGKKSTIYAFNLEKQMQSVSVLQTDIPLFSQQVVLDYHSCQAVFYNSKDDMMALLKFGISQTKSQLFQIGNKIQNLSFYYSAYVIIGFKDQSIKMLKLSDLPNTSDQPRKKVKKVYDAAKHERKQDMMEEEIKQKEPNVMRSKEQMQQEQMGE